MVMSKNQYLYYLVLVFVSINIVSCGEAMTTIIEAKGLEEKWDESINNSSESWWYAGSESDFHYIAIKIPYSSKIYKVSKNEVKIEGIDWFDFTKKEDEWVNIKDNNIKFSHASQ